MSEHSMPGNHHVVVVGGGLGGLVAALEVLRQAPGTAVTVLEGSPVVGGKLRLAEVGGHVVDVGAEAMLALRPEAVELVESIGAGAQLCAPETTSASVWSRGTLHPLPRATVMGVPAHPEEALGILTDDEVARARDERPWTEPLGEDVAVGTYVGARLGEAVVDRLVEPLLGGVYAGNPHELSLRATLPMLWPAVLEGRSLTRTAARAMGADPRPAAQQATAARDSGRASPRSPFAGITGGVGRLPGLLADEVRRLGGEIRCDAMARELGRASDAWFVVVGPTTRPERIEADAVVVAVPPPNAARLLGPVAPGASAALGEIAMASSAVVTLAVTREGLGELPGSGFLVPPVDGHTVKAATFSANKWAWTGALDPALVHLRTSIGRAGEESALQRSDEELVEMSVRELGEALGRTLPAVVDAHVQRWGGGLPQYLVGHLDRVERVHGALASRPGLEVTGAAYEGVGIPAVVASARRAATGVGEHLASR